jgi:hypothetical protein
MKYEVTLEGWKAGLIMLCAAIGAFDLFVVLPVFIALLLTHPFPPSPFH